MSEYQAGIIGKLERRWAEVAKAIEGRLAAANALGWRAALPATTVTADTVAVGHWPSTGWTSVSGRGSEDSIDVARSIPLVRLRIWTPARTQVEELLDDGEALVIAASGRLDRLAMDGVVVPPPDEASPPTVRTIIDVLEFVFDLDDADGAATRIVPGLLADQRYANLTESAAALPGEGRIVLHAALSLDDDQKKVIERIAGPGKPLRCIGLDPAGPRFALLRPDRAQLVTSQDWTLVYAPVPGDDRARLELSFVGTFRGKAPVAVGFDTLA